MLRVLIERGVTNRSYFDEPKKMHKLTAVTAGDPA